MFEYQKTDDFSVVKENLLPIAIKDFQDVNSPEELLEGKSTCVSFDTSHRKALT